MNRKAVLLVLAALVVGGGLWLRSYFSPMNVIKRTFAKAVEAFEREELLGATIVFDRGYRDEYGQSFEAIAGHIRIIHEAYNDLSMAVDPPVVFVQEGQARMQVSFVLQGNLEGQRGYILGSPQAPCTATLQWEELTQGWRITSTIDLQIPRLQDELDRIRRDS